MMRGNKIGIKKDRVIVGSFLKTEYIGSAYLIRYQTDEMTIETLYVVALFK